jgi:hypothetical protein
MGHMNIKLAYLVLALLTSKFRELLHKMGIKLNLHAGIILLHLFQF